MLWQVPVAISQTLTKTLPKIARNICSLAAWQHMDNEHGGGEHGATHSALNKLSWQHITVSSPLLNINQPYCLRTWFLIQSLQILASIMYRIFHDNVTTIIWSDVKFLRFIHALKVNLTSDQMTVITLSYTIDSNICKDWIKNQVLRQCGGLIFDNGEDTVMYCYDNMYR